MSTKKKKIKIAFFDTKPYDRTWFDALSKQYRENGQADLRLDYFEYKLNPETAAFAKGSDVVCAFVNDDLSRDTLEILAKEGVQLIAMRCAGYNNVDIHAAFGQLHVVRVPAYSPYAVAEHAMALLLTLNRRLHKAYNRTRDFNYSLVGLTGMDLHGKTVGVIGTGRIGQVFIDICRGFGMKVLAYDVYPKKDSDYDYVKLDTLLQQSDVVSLHCPLTEQTRHILNKENLAKMKPGALVINTSRGALIDSHALLRALQKKKLGGAGLDVYEEEAEWFYEDHSEKGVQDETLELLSVMPNVLITSHQAFLTQEALQNIAEVTLSNIYDYFVNNALPHEICYQCGEYDRTKKGICQKKETGSCF